jgi:DNA-binding transcriptional MerR regulator
MHPLKINSSYRIGELCALFHVSPRALRFYEEVGLLAPDRDYQQSRLYSREDYNRIRVITWGRRASLSLQEIRELLDEYDSADQGRAQMAKALAKLRAKAAELDAHRAHIGGEIAQLEARLADMDHASMREQHAA